MSSLHLFANRRTRTLIPRLEILEDRFCPSCAVRLAETTLLVLGDSLANRVEITDHGVRGVRVVCDDDRPADFADRIDHIVVRTDGGSDSVIYDMEDPDLRSRHLRVDLGPGENTFTLNAPAGIDDPGLRPVVHVLGGPDTDQVTARFGTIDGGLQFRTDLGAGNDRLDVSLLGSLRGSAPVRFAAHGQGGDDALNFMYDDPGLRTVLGTPLTVAFDGGPGDDRLIVGFQDQDAEEMPAPLAVTTEGDAGRDWLQVDLGNVPLRGPVGISLRSGADDDQITVAGFNAQPSQPGTVASLDVQGNEGDDRMEIGGFNPQPDPLGAFVSVNVQGGSGDDFIIIHYSGALNGALRVRLDGGDGNDRIDARLQFDAESRGRVVAEVFGGAGDDHLTLAIDDPGLLTDIAALIDGGDGFDIFRRMGPVEVINCEAEEPLGG
jgi:hypothetical protein